jgi:hypothetical protein
MAKLHQAIFECKGLHFVVLDDQNAQRVIPLLWRWRVRCGSPVARI